MTNIAAIDLSVHAGSSYLSTAIVMETNFISVQAVAADVTEDVQIFVMQTNNGTDYYPIIDQNNQPLSFYIKGTSNKLETIAGVHCANVKIKVNVPAGVTGTLAFSVKS